MTIETLLGDATSVPTCASFKARSPLDPNLYRRAHDNRLEFWQHQAHQIQWFSPWQTVLDWQRPYAAWFKEGTLNACYNCLDVHLPHQATKTALIWESEQGEVRQYTYQQLYDRVNQLAYQLRTQFDVKKGDRVTLYLPMVPEVVIAMLACARIGAIHSVVFAGFSAESLCDRIQDSTSKVLITANGGYRRGRVIPLKDMVDDAVRDCPSIQTVIVVEAVKNYPVTLQPGRDSAYTTLMAGPAKTIPAEPMASEDILFILYTSGTTGKPKGIMHSTGGYMTHARYSFRTVFDYQEPDRWWCTADAGWITGHTYLVYGPMANGATVFMYEGTPDFPTKHRFWELIESHKITLFYTAPTAIRAFMKWGESWIAPHDIASLRLLGTVGEPINPEAWRWYYTVIGQKRCPIVDTWWQTETGGIMISNLPALNDMKPGVAGLPLPGITCAVLDEQGRVVQSGGGLLSLIDPWPSMLRGIWGDSVRFKETYWSTFETYFSGDGAVIDTDKYVMVLGRVDDVLNVSGHRIGTMEIESALVEHDGVAEAAVVGMPDALTGQAIVAFVMMMENDAVSADDSHSLRAFVAKKIGAIAKPKHVVFTSDLPKTRSGKIMRRILKAIVSGQPIGDVTTLADPHSVTVLQDAWMGVTQ